MISVATFHRYWSTRAFAVFIAFILSSPLWWPAIPPLIDLPGHMAIYAMAIEPVDRLHPRFYSFGWKLIGNTGVNIAVYPVAKLIGIELATKLITILTIILTAIGYLLIASAAHIRRPVTILFALPLVYCFPFYFGFINYCFAMALMLISVGLWMRWKSSPWKRSAYLLLAAPLIWVSHSVPWFLLCVVCGLLALNEQIQAKATPIEKVRSVALTVVPLISPLWIIPYAVRNGRLEFSRFFDFPMLAKVTVTLFRDRWIMLDLVSLGLVACLLAATVTRRFGLRFNRQIAIAGAALILVALMAPAEINDAAFVNARILPYGIALSILAVNPLDMPRRTRSILGAAAIGFFCVRLIGMTTSMVLYDRSYHNSLALIDHIPRYSRVASFTPNGCGQSFANWFNPRMDHLGGLVVVRKSGFTNSIWTNGGLQLLSVTYPAAGRFQSDPSETVISDSCGSQNSQPTLSAALSSLPRSAFDFVWMLGAKPSDRPRLPWLSLVGQTKDSALYQIVAPSDLRTEPGIARAAGIDM